MRSNARVLGARDTRLQSYEPAATSLTLRKGEGLFGNDELLVASVRVLHGDGQALGTAIVGLRRDYVNSILSETRQKMILFTSVMLIAGLVGAVSLVSALLRPIGVLRRGLRRIGDGDLDTRIELRQRTELGLLADTINDVTGRLKRSRLESQSKEQDIVDTPKRWFRSCRRTPVSTSIRSS